MSSTEGPNAASMGSISKTGPRVQAVPGVSNPEILGSTGNIRNTEVRNTKILRILAVYNPEILA